MSLELKVKSILKGVKVQKTKTLKFSSKGTTIALIIESDLKKYRTQINKVLSPWQKRKLKDHNHGSISFESTKGPLRLIVLKEEEKLASQNHDGLLDSSVYSEARDLIGSALTSLNETNELFINLANLEYDQIVGALIGLDMSFYDFQSKVKFPKVNIYAESDAPESALKEALKSSSYVSEGVNISRLLVDTPPCDKKPEDYAKAVTNLFEKTKHVKVTTWDEKKLKKENMGLHLAVGAGADQGPTLVHISYRPPKSSLEKPVAFVGKGITFDTGGLNLKPGNSMRLMKKDMGGSASLVGLALAVTKLKLPIEIDFYLALAENSVDEDSFRPSDVIVSRSGLKVEIDNTDAEGRLVMADALALATEKKPLFVIDVATLTGAIKVGLGSDLAGFFSTDDALSYSLQNAAQLAGEGVWRMPLMQSQRDKLKSDFADLANSASGFGGAIRAAMFLKEFTNKVPWAHFDIYGWNDGKKGPYRHSGGNGQMVQALTLFLSQLSDGEEI